MTSVAQSALMLGVTLCSTTAGAIIGWLLPAHHRGKPMREHGITSVAIVSTIAALGLSLAINNTNVTRIATRQDLTVLSSNIIRVDSLLRRYGEEADPARTILKRYAALKLEDLFPKQPGKSADLLNADTAAALDQLQDGLAGLQPGNDTQRWQRSQALELSNQIALARWTIAERDRVEIPAAGINVLAFWLAILFGTYGLFMPRNVTAAAISVLSALAVACAMLLILDARRPFDGVTHLSSRSLAEAVNTVQR